MSVAAERRPDIPAIGQSRFGFPAMVRLRAVFERSRHPMLIADDSRRWVTGNAAAGELLGVSRAEIPWHTMDDFTPAGQRQILQDEWNAFLADDWEAEGFEHLYVPNRGAFPVEFSATANVLPGRHLSVVIPVNGEVPDESALDRLEAWTAVKVPGGGRLALTERESEVITLVASGLQSNEIADRLFLSPETVKSHVNNAMGKLGVHTRAHAVAVALVSGQISWDIFDAKPARGNPA
jgi:PAS domain S-box-containing protein